MKGILKKIIIFVVVFICIVVVWSMVSGKKDSSESLTSSSGTVDTSLLSTEQSVVADEFLNTLINLHTITLDDAIFSDARFASLVDYTVQLTPQTVGRSNPFTPVGFTPSSTTIDTEVENTIEE
ncbi:MAG: hypothetical protein KBB88_03460 [Candidatus Pacebacteria bacterium]|nr:hypothetical protein [Candidatus Paceibacterota bacterium]